ncbi:MAG: hypothetical protein OXH94_16085, partial [Rhodospirillales bacterium]|nr:hypothetical protein [Rhodospirillales bacterium]
MSRARSFAAKLAVRLSRPSIILSLALGLGLGACAEPEPKPAPDTAALRLIPAGFGALGGWAGDDHRAALGAMARSCAKFSRQPASR